MLSIKSGRLSVMQASLVAVFLFLGAAGSSWGQGDEPTPGELLKEATRLMQSQQYESAVVAMVSYLELVEESTAPRVIAIAQDVRFKLATILVTLNRRAEAIEYLEKYVSEDLGKHYRKAHKMLVACYFESEMYTECLTAVTNALYYNENPVVVASSVQGRDIDEIDPFAEEDAATDEDRDPPYTQDEITMLEFTRAESLFKLEQWAACIEPFTFVSENTKDDQRKGYSIMQMINAYMKLADFDRIIDWVPELYRTSARYDIRVNLALLNAASALYDAEEYNAALPLYRMIIPKDELLEYQEAKLRELRIEAGLPPEEGEAMTADEQMLFGEEDASRSAQESSSLNSVVRVEEVSEEEAVKPPALLELEGLVKALKEMPPYENHVDFQMAQVYGAVERLWEAVRFYDRVFDTNPSSEIGQRSLFEAVLVLTDQLEDGQEAASRAISYMEEYKSGLYPRLVAYLLTSYYQRNKEWKAIDALQQYIDEFTPTNNVDITKFDTELYFMQGVADLMLQDYTNAVEGFSYVVDTYPGTAQEGNSLFWLGFSYLCLDQHENAFECFERYTQDFPEGTLLDEAYYQGGISLFGMDQLDRARERFTYVIERFGTNSTVYPESCNMRGDILGSLGGNNLDLAIADYQSAFDNATKASQATYAIFKMCDIYKADEQFYGPEYVIKAVNEYLAQWGDEGADISKALLYIGRTKVQQGKYEEAATSYLEAVLDYGDNLMQEGVDLMLPELVKISSLYLLPEQKDGIITRMKVALETTDSNVLALRLRVALAKFDKTEVELGQQLLSELSDLQDASPPVLAAICEASFASEDYSRSEELLWTFKNNFPDSMYMRSAYKLHASGQFKAEQYEETLQTIASAQAEYGTEPDVAWAQLMKAQTLLDQSILFSSTEPFDREELDEVSRAQLRKEQDRMTVLKEDLAKAQEDPEKEAEVKRLLADQEKLEEKISSLELAVQGDSPESSVRALLARCKLDDAREENMNVMGVPEWRGAPVAQAIYQLGLVEEAAGNLRKAHAYFQRAYFQYKAHSDGLWAAEGYLAAARVLGKLAEDPSLTAEEQSEMQKNVRNTYRAMLFDSYVNQLPQAEVARTYLGADEVTSIQLQLDAGTTTNIAVSIATPGDAGSANDENTSSDASESGAGNEASGEGDA